MSSYNFPLITEKLLHGTVQNVLSKHGLEGLWPALQSLGFDTMERFALLDQKSLDAIHLPLGYKQQLAFLAGLIYEQSGMPTVTLVGNLPHSLDDYLTSVDLGQYLLPLRELGYDTLSRFALFSRPFPEYFCALEGHKRMLQFIAVTLNDTYKKIGAYVLRAETSGIGYFATSKIGDSIASSSSDDEDIKNEEDEAEDDEDYEEEDDDADENETDEDND